MNSAVIVAGGSGSRMESSVKKQYIRLNEREILSLSIEAFEKTNAVDEIVVAVPAEDINYVNEYIVDKYGFKKVRCIVSGGDTRQASVLSALTSCNKNTDIVAIHDGARPFVSKDVIEECFRQAESFGGAACAVKVKDTLKSADDEMFFSGTSDREKLYMVQTPQAFNYKKILEAHKWAKESGFSATDDTQIAEKFGMKVKIVEGSYLNIKITTKEDILISQGILNSLNKIK